MILDFLRRLFRRKPKSGKWRMFFDMKHPEKRRVDLGVYEGSAADAVEACYNAQMMWAFNFMSAAPEPDMAVMGNYGIEEIKDEHPSAG